MAGIDILQVLQQITAAAARANDAVLHLIVGSLHFLDKRRGNGARRLHQRPKNSLAESMSCDEVSESVNVHAAAQGARCATFWSVHGAWALETAFPRRSCVFAELARF